MLRCVTLALAVATGVGIAAAQTPPVTVGQGDGAISHPPAGGPTSPPVGAPSSQLQLTSAQKTAILNAVRRDNGKAASPVNFVAAVGAPVPPSIELYVLPDLALADVPEAKIMKYTRVQNQVVLVDPTTMRVVDIIGEVGR
jgi:Protein of unknown function (DUF1236)